VIKGKWSLVDLCGQPFALDREQFPEAVVAAGPLALMVEPPTPAR
jgi:hypothetical protein